MCHFKTSLIFFHYTWLQRRVRSYAMITHSITHPYVPCWHESCWIVGHCASSAGNARRRECQNCPRMDAFTPCCQRRICELFQTLVRSCKCSEKLFCFIWPQDEIVRLLVEHGAKIADEDKNGNKAIDLAGTGNHKQTVNLLKSKLIPRLYWSRC